MNLELSKLPLDFYTDPVWREQDYDKEQQSRRNEGINVHIFFSSLESKSWYFLNLFLYCRQI